MTSTAPRGKEYRTAHSTHAPARTNSPIRMAASTVALRPCPCAQCTRTLRPAARCASAQLTPCWQAGRE